MNLISQEEGTQTMYSESPTYNQINESSKKSPGKKFTFKALRKKLSCEDSRS